MINDDILASIEYACHVVGAKLIVVLGHTRCGAIEAACTAPDQAGYVPQLLDKIKPAINAENTRLSHKPTHDKTYFHNITELNIANTLYQIYKQSPVLKEEIDSKDIGMVGATYDVNTGKVHFKDFAERVSQLHHEPIDGLTEQFNTLIPPKN